MIRIFLIIISLLFLSSSAYADPPDKTQEEEPFFEHQKRLSKEVGIVLPGMTKQDVRETYGLLKPKVWYTQKGEEVWYYKSPREQNIYFKGDIVERVEYLEKKRVEPLKEDKKQIDL